MTEAPIRRTQAERREATRAKLLDATVECLAELGYAGTTTTEVSRRAGVSRGAQLHHFPTRADLVAAAARHVLATLVEEFAVTMGALPQGPERIQAAIDLLAGIFAGPTVGAWHELVLAGRTDPELGEQVAAIDEEMDAVIAELWGELFPAGLTSLDPDLNDAVPALLFGVLNGNAIRAMTGSRSAARRNEQALTLVKLLAAYFDDPAPRP